MRFRNAENLKVPRMVVTTLTNEKIFFKRELISISLYFHNAEYFPNAENQTELLSSTRSSDEN